MRAYYVVRPMGDTLGPRPGIDRYQYGDGLFGFLGKVAKAILKPLANLVPKNTIFSKALVAVGMASPKQAIATTAIGVGLGAVGAAMVPGAPSLPGMASSAFAGGVGTATSPTGGWGPRGPGNKLQWPWQDPNVQAGMKQWALDDSFLKVMYRAPRGYVVVRDANGKPYPLQKWAAKRVGWWREPRKPPITAGEWHQYQTSIRVEKKLAKIARRALHRHGGRTARAGIVNIRESGPGSQVVQFRKKA